MHGGGRSPLVGIKAATLRGGSLAPSSERLSHVVGGELFTRKPLWLTAVEAFHYCNQRQAVSFRAPISFRFHF